MVKLKTKEEIEKMSEGGKILAEIIRQAAKKAEPGISTKQLDKFAHDMILENGDKPSFLNYRGYPASTCLSINDEIVHGIPSERKLSEGDLLTIDIGLLHKGFHTDSAITIIVGDDNSHVFNKKYTLAKKIIDVTRNALDIGIELAKAGNTIGDLGSAIHKYVKEYDFDVVRELVGHGIGEELHESPEVMNFGKPGIGPKLEVGMVIAIEPMVVQGDWRTIEVGEVFKTKDGLLSAHFEHTVAITSDGPLILTK